MKVETRERDCTDCILYWLNNNSKTPCGCGGGYLLERCNDFISKEFDNEQQR